MTTSSMQIHSRALLVWLTISTWTARKYDRTISEKVNREYAASRDAGRYNKFLLPGDAVSYKLLVALAGGIRAAHYGHTLAWSDEGWRLLPTSNYMAYTTWYRKQQQMFTTALDDFAAAYPGLRTQASRLLNGLYRDEDYPSTQDLRQRFALDVQYSPVPAVGDIRVDLASDQIAAIETSITGRVEHAVMLAVQDAWKRLYDVVSRVSERLSQPDAIFRDSLIGNAREICESLKHLNVTDDPDLERMRLQVLKHLTQTDPDLLRDNPNERAKIAIRADAILQTMKGFYDAAH